MLRLAGTPPAAGQSHRRLACERFAKVLSRHDPRESMTISGQESHRPVYSWLEGLTLCITCPMDNK